MKGGIKIKHSFLSMCVILLALFLAGCGAAETKPEYVGEVSPYAEKEAFENVRLYMEDTSIAADAERVVFYIENQRDEEFLYGVDWLLEVFYEGTWHSIPIKLENGNDRIAYASIGIISRAGKTNKEKLSFGYYHYQFKSGTYRWVQYVREEDKIMSVEFQMD